MLSRSLLTRSRLSAALTTRTCSRSLSTLRLAHPPLCAVPRCASLRWLSTAPAFPSEGRDNTKTPPTPSGTCYIANIPYKVTAEQLKEAFSEFGKIASLRLVTSDAGLSRGIGFVRFESVADAVHFVEAHSGDPIFILDRQLFVAHAQSAMVAPGPPEPSDTLVVFGFPGDSEDRVRGMFGDDAGNIMQVRFIKKEAGQPSRKVFVQFRNVDAATKAMDVFKNYNEDTRIAYARHRQSPAASSLTSRLSQHRDQ